MLVSETTNESEKHERNTVKVHSRTQVYDLDTYILLNIELRFDEDMIFTKLVPK